MKSFSKVLSLTIQKEKEPQRISSPIYLGSFRQKTGQAPAKIYATLSNLDPLFELEGSSLDRLDKTAKDLRLTKLITSMERFSIKRLEFQTFQVARVR